MLVANKALAAQLIQDFGSLDIFELHGHSHYKCFDQRIGECRYSEADCLYSRACAIARTKSIVITNIDHQVVMCKNGTNYRLGKFDAIILDEAHTAHEILVKQLAVEFSDKRLQTAKIQMSLPEMASIARLREWASELSAKLYREIQIATDNGLSSHESIEQQKLLNIRTRLMQDCRLFIENSTKDEWIIADQLDTRWTGAMYRVQPVWGKRYVAEYLFNSVPQILLCSATISSTTLDLLGMQSDSYSFTEVVSSFPVERRPFYYFPAGALNHYSSAELKQYIYGDVLGRWLEPRLANRGIVHSVSYGRADEIRDALPSSVSKYLVTHRGQSAIDAIRGLASSPPPYVLCSPSVVAGFDLADDLCRHQAIVKVPWPDMNDPVTARRVKQMPSYMAYVAAMTVVQMYGRPNRSKDDWSETIIFDSLWSRVIESAWVPQYFREAIRVVDVIPSRLQLTA